MSRLLALLCALGILTGGAAARAAPLLRSQALLGQARKAAGALDYPAALRLAQQGLAAGDATAALTVELSVLEAELSAAVGLTEDATRAYARALSLSPSLTLPVNASPRLARPFAQAQRSLNGAHLVAVPRSTLEATEQVRTRVTVEGDVLRLVAGVEVRPLEGPPAQLSRTDAFEGYWPCTRAPCRHTVSLRDSAGNELLRVGTDASPLLVLPLAPPAAQADTRPFYRRGWPYVVLASALVATGGYFAVRTAQTDAEFRQARDVSPERYRLSEVQALDGARTREYALTATSFGLALGAGAAGVLLW